MPGSSSIPSSARLRRRPTPRCARDRLRAMDEQPLIRATTVICVHRDGQVAMAGDGQVTIGTTVMKHGAAKVRRIFHDKILAAFAGPAPDPSPPFAPSHPNPPRNPPTP